jgi:predicted metal-dependent enzyme (double-stranded beta helix superfamily)
MIEITPGFQRLKELIEQDKEMSLVKAEQYLRQAQLEIADLMPYADFDHPVEDGYGRKMVVDSEHFEIMVMTWNPGDFSAVHDHGYTTWGAVQVFGNVMHHTFSMSKDLFRLTRKEILPEGAIVKVNNALIHQMGNVTSSPYLTVHLYGNSQRHGNITADSRIFEMESALIKHTTGGAFFNLPNEAVYEIEKMPEIEHATMVHQLSLLIQYYQRFDEEKAEELTRSVLDRFLHYQH